MKMNIETERLIIRNLEIDDYQAMFLWCGDPEVNTYMLYPVYENAEQVKEYIKTLNKDDPDNYDGGIVLKETGELIGSGGLVYHKESDVWAIGYNLRKDQWGNGYAKEAIEGIMEHIRKTREIHVVEAEIALENKNSIRAIEKLGLTYHRDASYTKLDNSKTFKAAIYRREF